MSVWFTSDTHFNHKLVAKERGYVKAGDVPGEFVGDPEDFGEAVVQAWNVHVRPDDLVYHLGDVGLGDYKSTLAYAARLNGRKRLIAGNHDKVWGGHIDSWKYMRDYLEVFEGVQMYAKVKIAGVTNKAVMSHLPYYGAGEGKRDLKERYSEFRLHDTGLRILIHGHTHSDDRIDGPRSIHVGWDAWHRPVHLDEVRALALTLEVNDGT